MLPFEIVVLFPATFSFANLLDGFSSLCAQVWVEESFAHIVASSCFWGLLVLECLLSATTADSSRTDM